MQFQPRSRMRGHATSSVRNYFQLKRQSVNQSIDRSISQSVNQSVNQSTILKEYMTLELITDHKSFFHRTQPCKQATNKHTMEGARTLDGEEVTNG